MGRKPIQSDDDFDTASAIATLKPSMVQERWGALSEVAEQFKGWRPAPEVLTSVRSVRTVFPMFDRATRVGGYPIDRVNTVHGPSGNGKTSLSLGLGLSFLQQGHFFAHIDAEMTTPSSWISTLFGDQVRNPGFVAMRPNNYEEAIDGTRNLVETIASARAKGGIPQDTTALIVVDSVRKLVPKALMEKIRKEGADGLGGRAGQLKAAMNQAWLDDLTPLLNHTGTSVLLIARESERPDASDIDRKFDAAWKVQGGTGIIYDASLVMRCTRASWVYGPGPVTEKRDVYGEKIKVSIWKTKVESKDAKHALAFFHTSNGRLVPEGFDRARDVLELAKSYSIIDVAGSWYSYNGQRLGQGENNVVVKLTEDHDLRTHIEDACRAEFVPEDVIPMGHDEGDA